MLTCQETLKEIKDESYLTLFRRLKSCAQTELTRKSLHQQKTAMHHHTENESSLFSCLVLSSFVFSSLSVPVFFLCLCLSLSVSVSVSVWCCGRVVVLCCVCGVVCRVWHAEKPRVSTQHVSVCTFKTSPCVAPRAHMFQHVCAWCRYKRRRFERTHGDVFHRQNKWFFTFLEHLKRMWGSSLIDNVLLTMNGPHMGYHVLQRFTKESRESLPI